MWGLHFSRRLLKAALKSSTGARFAPATARSLRAATIRPSSLDESDGSVEIVIATSSVVTRSFYDWESDDVVEYDEVLSVDNCVPPSDVIPRYVMTRPAQERATAFQLRQRQDRERKRAGHDVGVRPRLRGRLADPEPARVCGADEEADRWSDRGLAAAAAAAAAARQIEDWSDFEAAGQLEMFATAAA
ncbi:hypothetical protein NPA31_005245 [Aurantimonas sp. MSK8Z-1]|uniref:hypothetical protein n=1 Tax=Mangrovibrevibacter kandeliae TaxID=2968473 RepID=UPI0021175B5C|nr:hypothetical protein [Aurantimonas sp. MSK8Z-1]MCW4114367.1 hypothetical protein [Aurantimonas sp. MSK8Z-1]